MPRFFVGTDQISDKDIVITGTDVNHIRNVLRMTPGEEVTVSDGQGMDYFCRIAELTKEEVRLDIVDSWHSFVELPAKIYLFQGLPKADKMELIIQKIRRRKRRNVFAGRALQRVRRSRPEEH